jgi:CCR4-NOT transcription complex subunit 3
MERFKVIEKEIKTKAFSKEGLTQSAKLDPKDVQKNSTLNWINSIKDDLQIHMDKFEAESEALLIKDSKRDSSRVEMLKKKLARHKYYIDNLEAVQRLIRNDILDHNEILDKKDDIEYYLECSVEEDFEDTLEVFEGMDLKAVEAKKHQLGEDSFKRAEKPPERAKVEAKTEKAIVEAKKPKIGTKPDALPSPFIPAPIISENAPSFASAASLNISKQPSIPSIVKETKDTTKDPFSLLKAQIETFSKQPMNEGLKKAEQSFYRLYSLPEDNSKYSVPTYYPSEHPKEMQDDAFFKKLSPETLFFIFYYQQQTRAQQSAARELKSQAWRFHNLHKTWFQRLEEPTEITDTYEQGSYLFFDFEESWTQKKRSDFNFEYRYLEEEEYS